MFSSSTGQLIPQEYLDEYQADTLIAICGLFIALETLFVALRYYARHLMTASFGWDDAIIPAAWLTNVGLCILGITAVHDAGVGRHLAAVLKYHPKEFTSLAKSLYALEWLYLTSVALPKMSVLCLYLRLFTSRAVRLTCYFLLGVVGATWVAYIVAANLQCIPLAYQLDKSIPGGHCLNIEAYYKSTSVPNIATDLVILVLPIQTVINLKVSKLRKLGLSLIFLVGSIGLIGSCVRMSTFFQVDAFTDNTCTLSSTVIFCYKVRPSLFNSGLGSLDGLVGRRTWNVPDRCVSSSSQAHLGQSLAKRAECPPSINGPFRTPQSSESNGSQGFRRKAQPLGKSSAGSVELQHRHDRRSASEEEILAPSPTHTVRSLRTPDVEQGLALPNHFES